MSLSTSCSWCHTVNAVGVAFCKTCGHSALLPRNECDCPACIALFAAEGAKPLPNPWARKDKPHANGKPHRK